MPPMKRPATKSLNKLFSGRFARFIVILFLAYAAVDIANPQLCNDEFAPSSVLLASQTDNSQENEQPEHPPAPHSEDDCFCCCTHVLPGLTTHPNGASDAVSQGLTLTPQSVTSAHLMALYHPPRTV